MAKESTLQNKVLKYFEENKIFCIKYNASGISKTGIPDIFVNLEGYFLAIETKTDTGITSPMQKIKIKQINKNGIAIVLRPSQFEIFKMHIDLFLIHKEKNKIVKLKNSLLETFGTE